MPLGGNVIFFGKSIVQVLEGTAYMVSSQVFYFRFRGWWGGKGRVGRQMGRGGKGWGISGR